MIERLRRFLRMFPIGTPESEPETTSYDPRLDLPPRFADGSPLYELADRVTHNVVAFGPRDGCARYAIKNWPTEYRSRLFVAHETDAGEYVVEDWDSLPVSGS